MEGLEEYKQFTLEAVKTYNEKDYHNALEKFQRLAKENYKNYKIHEVLCLIYLKLDNLKEAEKEYSIYYNLLKKQIPDLPEIKNFQDIIKDLENIDILEKKYLDAMNETDDFSNKNFMEIIQNSNDAIHLSIALMGEGEYEKAEKIIRDFSKKYSQINFNI